ncbi:MAG: septum formation initiator family protein [Fibrobacter sp.]|nr:septum formation initiator family protein [Fibrobacter sp.]
MNKRLFFFVSLVIIAIIAMAYQVFFGKNSLSQQRHTAHEISVYQAKIDSLEKLIELRNLRIERLKNDSLYKAEILRTRYGMSQKDEKVFQLVK